MESGGKPITNKNMEQQEFDRAEHEFEEQRAWNAGEGGDETFEELAKEQTKKSEQ